MDKEELIARFESEMAKVKRPGIDKLMDYIRKHDFEHVENPYTQEEAMQEVSRCLRCDHFGCGVLKGGRDQ